MIHDDIRLSEFRFEEAKKHPKLEAETQNLSLTTLCYIPTGYNTNDKNSTTYLNTLNEKLLTELQTGGRVFLSNTVVFEKYCLRGCGHSELKTVTKIKASLPMPFFYS